MRQLRLPHFGKAVLLLAEGHAVSALVLGGIALMGAHHDLIQGAVVFLLAVVCTLVYGAFNGLVCVTVHKKASFEFGFASSMCAGLKIILGTLSNIAFFVRI